VRRINRHGINRLSTMVVIERYLGPQRHFSGTLIREWMADARLNVHMVVALCLGTMRPRKGIENRMLKRYVSSPLSCAELSWLMIARTCNIGKGPGWNHLCRWSRWTTRGPGLGRAEWGGGIHLRDDAEPNGQYDRLFPDSGCGLTTGRVRYGQ